MSKDLLALYQQIRETPALTVDLPEESGKGRIVRLDTNIFSLSSWNMEFSKGSDVMSSFEIRDCSVSGSIVGGGEYTDAVVGDPACALSVDCQSDMSITETVSDAA